MDFKNLLEIAKIAAQKASVEILRIYDSGDFSIEAKSDHSPLTLADKASHQAIVKELEPTEIPILSEEGNSKILSDVRNYYDGKVIEHGASSKGVDWNGIDSHYLRFDQLHMLFDTDRHIFD